MSQILLPGASGPGLALSAFPFPETLMGAVPYGQGHINGTYCVLCQPREGECLRYILQRINTHVFPDPMALMENFDRLTDYLRRQIAAEGGDPQRETPALIKTKDGSSCFTAPDGQVWRLMPLIENTVCYQSATPELFEASAYAFGLFQHRLKDFPAHTLREVIPKFHDTVDRFHKFQSALAADTENRAQLVREEIDFVFSREKDCAVAMDALARGELPLRVTHNDTKLNNVLFDRHTGKALCVIDLDTTMPGLSINDFGDSIRFGANHAREDEKDLSKVNFDLSLYEVYTRGFLAGAQGSLTRAELDHLPWGARLMTLECGIRFLTDYLEGDHYFTTAYPGQNLDRARTQFKLVRDMEGCFDDMAAVVRKFQ